MSPWSPGSGDEVVVRAEVPDDKITWNKIHEWYDPPEFTSDNVAETDTDDMWVEKTKDDVKPCLHIVHESDYMKTGLFEDPVFI